MIALANFESHVAQQKKKNKGGKIPKVAAPGPHNTCKTLTFPSCDTWRLWMGNFVPEVMFHGRSETPPQQARTRQ